MTQPQLNNPETPPPRLLLVLSGSQKGAHLNLRNRRFHVGSDNNNDIVLAGNGVANKHFDAVSINGSLVILHAHAPILLNGKPLKSFPAEPQLGDILSLGDVALAYNSIDAPPPNDDALAAALAPYNSNNNNADDADDTDDTDNPDDPDNPDELDDSPNTSPPPHSPTHPPPDKPPPRRVLAPAALALAAPIVIVASLYFAFSPLQQPSEPVAQNSPDNNAPLLQLLKQPTFQNVSLLPNNILAGFVASDHDLHTLRNAAKPILATVRVKSLLQVRRALNVILNLYGPLLIATFKTPQDHPHKLHLEISGLVQNSDGLAAFKKQVQQEIPFIDALHTHAVTANDANHAAQQALAQYPALKNLSSHADSNGVRISGPVLSPFLPQLHSLKQRLINALPPNVPVSLNVMPSPPLNAHVQAVLIAGSHSHARIAWPEQPSWNAAYKPGAPLPQGFQLKSVLNDGVVLSYGGNNFFLPAAPAPKILALSKYSTPNSTLPDKPPSAP